MDIGWLVVGGVAFILVAGLAHFFRVFPEPLPRDVRVLIIVLCLLPTVALGFFPNRLRMGPRAASASRILLAAFLGALVAYLLDRVGVIDLPQIRISW